jgi:O-antigen/teichoic acid export membrane protein
MFSKIKTLLSHSVTYGLGNSANRFVGFFLLPLYTRYLTPEDYGVLALVTMFGEVLYIAMNMGQSSALFRTYFLHDDPQERETVVTTSLWLMLMLSFPLGLVALALSRPLSSILIGSPDYMVWVMIGVGAVVFKALLRMPQAVLRAREQSRKYALSSLAQTVISLTLAIFFVVGLHLGGRGVLLSQLLAELLLCLYLIPTALTGLSLKFSRRDAGEMLGYGVYIMPTAFCSFLLRLSDRYFLRWYTSLETVGLYSLGKRLGEILTFPMQAFELAWPQFLFSNAKSENAPALYARVFTYLLTVLGFLWLAVALVAEEVVKILMHASFYEAHRVVPWVAGAFLMQGLNYAGNVGINLHRKVKYRPLIVATTAGLNLVLNFLLIPRYGMMGAAIATFASYTFQSTFRVLVSYWLYPVPYEYARLGRLVVVIGGTYIVGVIVAWGSAWNALAGKMGLLLLVPLFLYASGFFESGEIARLKLLLTELWRRSRVVLQTRASGK